MDLEYLVAFLYRFLQFRRTPRTTESSFLGIVTTRYFFPAMAFAALLSHSYRRAGMLIFLLLRLVKPGGTVVRAQGHQ